MVEMEKAKQALELVQHTQVVREARTHQKAKLKIDTIKVAKMVVEKVEMVNKMEELEETEVLVEKEELKIKQERMVMTKRKVKTLAMTLMKMMMTSPV